MSSDAPPDRPLTEVNERAPLLGNQRAAEGAETREQPWHATTRRLTTLERLLLAVLLLLLCLAATFVGLFAGEKNAAKHRPLPAPVTETSVVTATRTQTLEPKPTPQPPRNEGVCLTPACVSAAAALVEGMDMSVDPCEDFYGFVNNGWLAAHPIPQDKSLFGTDQAISLDNKRVIQKYLEHDAHQLDLPKEDHANLQHLQAVYQSCMDERSLSQAGDLPIQQAADHILQLMHHSETRTPQGIFDPMPPIFTHLPQPEKPGDPTGPPLSSQLTRVLAYLHSHGIQALFTPFLSPDARADPEKQLLALQQADLGLPDSSYYQDQKLLKNYENTIKKVLSQLQKGKTRFSEEHHHHHNDKQHIEKLASQIVNFEKKLAQVMVSPLDLDDPQKIYNLYTIDELHELSKGVIDFRDYFASFSPRPGLPDPVIVTGPSYFKDIAKVVKETGRITLGAYFVWRTAFNLGPLLSPSEAIWKETHALSALLSGADPKIQDRQDFCIGQIQDQMGILAGHFYVRDIFPSDKKHHAQEIIESAVEGFVKRLSGIDWLDESTRKHAEEKAKAIRVKVGFPASPDALNAVALERYYALQAPFNKTDFAGNAERARVAEQRRLWNKIGAAVNHGEWEMIPTESNAYYTPEANEIVVPAGQIRPPFFSDDAPEYINFGGFGSLAGHELTHAFDKSGRQFDASGRLFDWWSNKTTANFDKRQQCIIDQYSSYTVQDPNGKEQYVNGEYTAGEDVADAGGLAAAFGAWEARFKSDQDGEIYDNRLLPGVSFTREQLFFVAYARGWARNIRPAEAARRVLVDPHSPTHFRVLGPLSNDDNFSKAFQCKKGSRYNPDRERCKVW